MRLVHVAHRPQVGERASPAAAPGAAGRTTTPSGARGCPRARRHARRARRGGRHAESSERCRHAPGARRSVTDHGGLSRRTAFEPSPARPDRRAPRHGRPQPHRGGSLSWRPVCAARRRAECCPSVTVAPHLSRGTGREPDPEELDAERQDQAAAPDAARARAPPDPAAPPRRPSDAQSSRCR